MGTSLDPVEPHILQLLFALLKTKIQPSKFEDLIDFFERFTNGAASHLVDKRCSEELFNGRLFFFFFLIKELLYLFIYFWLCWVFVSVRGLSVVAASGGHSSSRCAGLLLSRPLLLRSTGSRRVGSVVVAHGPICLVAPRHVGSSTDQGSNPCPLHWQADSQPLRHQGIPHNGRLLHSEAG